MHIWLLLAGTFLIQEFASTIVVLTTAHHEHISPALISLLWFGIVVPHVMLFYLIGVWFRRFFLHTRLGTWLHTTSNRLRSFAGKYGEDFSIFIFALFLSPALASVLGAFLELSFLTTVSLVVLADFLWYLLVWGIVLGITQLTTGLEGAIGIGLGVALCLTVGIHIARKKIRTLL